MITISNEKFSIRTNEDNGSLTLIIHKDSIRKELDNKLLKEDIELAISSVEKSKDINELMLSILTGSSCENCKIKDNCQSAERFTRCVPYGNLSSEIMFINKMPTELEFKTMHSHSDTLGIFLTLILNKLGYKREELYFTDLVKCYSEDMDEESCWHCIMSYIIKEIFLILPKAIVCEGMSVLKFLKETGTFEGLPEIRQLQYGKVYEVYFLNTEHKMKVISIYPLDKVLEKTGEEYDLCKQNLWQQLVSIKECIK